MAKAQHNPMDFVSLFVSQLTNTGNLLYLSIGIFSLSSFLKHRENAGYGGVFVITLVGLLLFIYNIVYSLKSIYDFKIYLKYFRKVKDQFDPVYTLHLPNWNRLIYYQYVFVSFVSIIGFAMLIWRIRNLP